MIKTGKSFIISISLFCLVMLLTSCSTGSQADKVAIKLEFPYKSSTYYDDSDTYYVRIYAEGNYGVKNAYKFKEVSIDEEFSKQIKVDKNATFIMVYLFRNDTFDEPEYFWRFDINSDKQTYKTRAWIDYHSREKIEYGFSEVSGKIVDIVAGNSPEIVYALDKYSNKLYYINPIERKIEKEISLPEMNSDPVAMAYEDKKLYIASEDSGSISVWDTKSESFNQIKLSGLESGKDIEVAPNLNRIYLLSASKLFILNMNQGQVVYKSNDISGDSIVIDAKNEKLYTADRGLFPSSIYRYSIADDSLVKEEAREVGGNGRQITISPDKSKVLLPCGGGNGPGSKLYAYKATDFNTVLGKWDIGSYPQCASFSPDGSLLYGSNSDGYDNYLYVMDAKNYSQIRKLKFPYSEGYSLLTPNSDGSVVVGFNYSGSDYVIYYFDNIKK